LKESSSVYYTDTPYKSLNQSDYKYNGVNKELNLPVPLQDIRQL